MTDVGIYSDRERTCLLVVGVAGLLGLNGIFVYALAFQPELLTAAMANPVSLAFIVEALLMTGVLAYLFRKWQVSQVSWPFFVALALVGGLAFAVPVVVLWNQRMSRRGVRRG